MLDIEQLPFKPIIDGKIRYLNDDTLTPDKNGKTWYVGNYYPLSDGSNHTFVLLRSWKTGMEEKYSSIGSERITDAEWKEINRRIEETRANAEKERKAEQAAAAAKYLAEWDAAEASPDSHDYLKRKGVQAHDCRVGKAGELLIPIRNEKGELRNLQRIYPDGATNKDGVPLKKRFSWKAEVIGCFHVLGTLEGAKVIYIAEGFATAATLAEIAGLPVVIAFNAGNLLPVATVIRRLHKSAKLILCADNDAFDKHGMPQAESEIVGIKKGKEAAREVKGALCVWPSFDKTERGLTDWNDLATVEGLTTAKAKFDAAVKEADVRVEIAAMSEVEFKKKRSKLKESHKIPLAVLNAMRKEAISESKEDDDNEPTAKAKKKKKNEKEKAKADDSKDEKITPETFPAFYDPVKEKFYLLSKKGTWTPCSEGTFIKHLKNKGVRSREMDTETISPADKLVLNYKSEMQIDYAAPLAGWKAGIHRIENKEVLVTQSPYYVEPKEGLHPLWDERLAQFMGAYYDPETQKIEDEKYGFLQFQVFIGQLSTAIKALYNGHPQQNRAAAFAGCAGAGKSFLQKQLITPILGGRDADPYRYITGQTSFNGEMFEAEHLSIGDKACKKDHASRMSFGQAIKDIVANHSHSCHPKGRQAFETKVFWFLTISLNEAPDSIGVLPPLYSDEGIADKLNLYRVYRADMPESPEEKGKYVAALRAELPHLSIPCSIGKYHLNTRTKQGDGG